MGLEWNQVHYYCRHLLANCTSHGFDDWRAVNGRNEWPKKPKYLENTCPNAALSTTDSTWLNQALTQATAVGSQ
jgi:hypothetical protein